MKYFIGIICILLLTLLAYASNVQAIKEEAIREKTKVTNKSSESVGDKLIDHNYMSGKPLLGGF